MLLPENFQSASVVNGFRGDSPLPPEEFTPSTTGEFERLCLEMLPEHLREDVPTDLNLTQKMTANEGVASTN